MRRPACLPLALLLAVALPTSAQVPTCTTTTTSGAVLTLTLTAPLPGTTATRIEPCPPDIGVDGTATLGLTLFDFYFVIDSSGSTGECTGEDIDGDGVVGQSGFGFSCSDPGDTVLAAEVKAVRDFVATLDPQVAKVAIIQFSDPNDFLGAGERQLVVQSLTDDLGLVGGALDTVLAFGSAGATDYAGGLQLLIGEAMANGDPLHRQQHAYFLSDGVPTFPTGSYGLEDPGDSQASVDAADQAAAAGIVVNTFGVGFIPSVTQDPVLPPRCEKTLPGGGTATTSTLECIALRTGGRFFASTNPADIVSQIQLVLPPTITSVVVTNDTTGQSVVAQLASDGTWTADVPIVFGQTNLISAVATADDGTSCRVDTDYTLICLPDPCVPHDCDDGDACTDDACDPATGCLHASHDCDDGIPCTDDSCDPATGCVHGPHDCAGDPPPVITTPPSFGGTSGCAFLWPPNHDYAIFTIADTGITVAQSCNPVSIRFVGCRSSQPFVDDHDGHGEDHDADSHHTDSHDADSHDADSHDADSHGDDHALGDVSTPCDCAVLADGSQVALRAEVSTACPEADHDADHDTDHDADHGADHDSDHDTVDRTYEVTIAVADDCGHVTLASASICVFHAAAAPPPAGVVFPGTAPELPPGTWTCGTAGTDCGSGCSAACVPPAVQPDPDDHDDHGVATREKRVGPGARPGPQPPGRFPGRPPGRAPAGR